MNRIISNLDIAVDELFKGHLLAIPTETVYGLAADATNSEAVKSVFSTKSRPINHPLIMHIGEGWEIEQWVSQVPHYAKKLMELFWPGPLTLIFDLNPDSKISEFVTGGQKTIAIRCPDHPLTLKLLDQFGKPMVAPSANPFGKVSPTNPEHVLKDFPNHSFYILDGGRCELGIESTILDATQNERCQIVREGLLNVDHLSEFKHYLVPFRNTKRFRAPGHLNTHYQPQKPAFYINKINTINSIVGLYPNCFLLHFSTLDCSINGLHYQFSSSVKDSAYEFYHSLRIADESKADTIILELPPELPEWKALRDKILKASQEL
ncbi:L-threonylcarbamoyladenylate synthase [Legionella yabuuchiae]|uniref:L-threonylcarbamoyladenylate synthase n=1 Tax=Legionella yabuuchiae TaxID=376727 RepID=UPI0010549913|nr:L-threonylcarbamoyladenylate synthase [Legionella yabuuchiae]